MKNAAYFFLQGFQLSVAVFDYDDSASFSANKTVDTFVVSVNKSLTEGFLADEIYFTHDRSDCGCTDEGTM